MASKLGLPSRLRRTIWKAANQGNTFVRSGSFTDPNSSTWTATVDYGDGGGAQSLPLNPNHTFTLSHAYPLGGVYTVSVTVTGSSGATGLTTLSLSVMFPVPTVSPGSNVTITEGSVFSRTASFTDPDSASWTGTVDYGDGSGAQPLTVNSDNTLNLSHFYADNGAYIVTVRLTNDWGYVTTGTMVVTVLNVPPVANFVSVGPLQPGQPVQFTFQNPFDPSPIDTAAGFTYSYDFNNDGIFEVTNTTSASWSYVFTLPGVYTVHGRIKDKDGGFTDFWISVTIGNSDNMS